MINKSGMVTDTRMGGIIATVIIHVPGDPIIIDNSKYFIMIIFGDLVYLTPFIKVTESDIELIFDGQCGFYLSDLVPAKMISVIENKLTLTLI